MENTQIKSFWQRPEGTTGKVLVAIGLGLVGFAVFHFMGAIADFFVDTMRAAYAIAALAVLGFIVTSKRVRTLAFYAFEEISRAITRNFVEIDPIGILRAFVKDMETKRATVKKAIEAMMTVRQKATAQRDLKQREMMDALKNAAAAQQLGNNEKLQELTERAGRRKSTIERLEGSITFANDSISTLQRVDRVIEYHINTSNDEVDELENENEMALAELAATHAANEALGDTDKLTVANMARDVVQDRTAKARASVESLMENTKSMQGDMDLTNMAQMQEGMKMLQQLQDGVANAENAQVGGKKNVQGAARILTEGTPDGTVPSTNRWAATLNKK